MPKDTLAYDDAAERIDFSVVTGASELALARDSERKQDAVARLMKAWENKNAQRAAKGLGLTMVAVSLAACGTEAEQPPAPQPEPADRTFLLTPGADTFVGGAGDDRFEANLVGLNFDVATLNNTDRLDGGAGNNTLAAVVTGNVTPLSLANIQTVSVQAIGDGVTLGLTNAPAVTTINVVGSNTGLTLANVQNVLTNLNIVNQGSSVTLQTAAAAVAGTSDVLNVSLSAVTGGTLTTNGYETLAITSGGAVANTLGGIAATGATTLTVAGAQNLTVSGELTNITTVNAAAATGNVSLTFGAGIHNVTGGAGNDRFTFLDDQGDGTYVGVVAGQTPAEILTRDIINGGAGRDTLVLTSANAGTASGSAQTNVTNVEIIAILPTGNTTGSINLTRFASADTLSLDITANNTIGESTFTFNSGSTLALTTGAAGDNARTYLVNGLATNDTLTITGAAGTSLGTAAQTFTGIETLTINTGAAGNGDFTVGNVVMGVSTGGAAKLVLLGGNTFNVGAVTANEIDASGLTGTAALNMTAAAAGAIKITGTGTADLIQGSSAADTIIAGAGNDIIVAGGGNDFIDITGGGSNLLRFADTAANNGVDTITGFAVGTSATADKLDFNLFNIDAGDPAPNAATNADLVRVAGGTNTLVAGKVTIVDFGGAIGGIDFGATGAEGFGQLFAAAGKLFSTTIAATGKMVLVVQGTDQTEVYMVDAGATTLTEAMVTQVAVLQGVTSADTLVANNFII